MLGPVGIPTQAVSEASASSGRDNLGDNFGSNLARCILSETGDFLNMDWIITFIDWVVALPAATLQDNF
jgi:hypothetical protein